jgi:hypothetical protein
MKSQVMKVAWYRFRVTFRRRWSGYLSLALLIGLIGGLALGGVAAARRTQSSFSTYVGSTNPSDLNMSIYSGSGPPGSGPSYTPALTRGIGHLRYVRHSRVGLVLNGFLLGASGAPRLNEAGKVYPVASPDGLFFNQDRATVTQGRMANPDNSNEIMMTASAARLLGLHLGQIVPYGFYTNGQESLPGFGTPAVHPGIRVEAKLVGFAVFSSSIVEDDIDKFPTFVVFTPALADKVLADGAQSFSSAATYGVQVESPGRHLPAVEQELGGVIPGDATFSLHAVAPVAAKTDRAIKPISIALGMFGGVALLAALLIATQSISRRLRSGIDDLTVLRALGADPVTTTADGLIGILGAIVLGSLLAALVALCLSPLSPLGPVRAVYPSRGLSVDWAVFGLGEAVLMVGLSTIAVVLAARGAPHRAAQRSRLASATGSKVVQAASGAGLPASAVVGVRMALESGGGRTAVPVRSALLGTALAVILVVSTVTFGSSLQTLVNRPALYGWNWTYMLNQVGAGSAGIPPQALSALQRDPDVAAATGVNYNDVYLDGQSTPFIFGDLNASITPPILSGHALEKPDQIVLGAATMAALHKRLGDTVVVSYASSNNGPAYIPPTHLVIVGTATMPAVGFASLVSDHTSMGNGALVPDSIISARFQNAVSTPYRTLNGPNLVFVRIRAGVAPSAGLANLRRIAASANRDFALVPGGAGLGNTVIVQGVQRPAEIVDYRTIGFTPALLVAALAIGAVVALALTLMTSVRRRRRDLALLKTLGFTQRQLAAAVAWHASVSALIGVVIGVPIGIILGRWLWDLFARLIYAVPQPTVPVASVALVALGALVLANIVAAIPGRMAARTPTALMLRAE